MPANHGTFHGNLDDKVSNLHEIPAATNLNNSSANSSCKLHELLPWLSRGRQILRIEDNLPTTPVINAWASPSSPLATPLPPRDLPSFSGYIPTLHHRHRYSLSQTRSQMSSPPWQSSSREHQVGSSNRCANVGRGQPTGSQRRWATRHQPATTARRPTGNRRAR